MAELADALDSGSSRGNSVEVQVLLAAIYTNEFKIWEFGNAGAPDLKQWNGDEAAQPE